MKAEDLFTEWVGSKVTSWGRSSVTWSEVGDIKDGGSMEEITQQENSSPEGEEEEPEEKKHSSRVVKVK